MITISMADVIMITKTNGTTTAAMCRPSLPFDGGNDGENQQPLATLICTSMYYIVCSGKWSGLSTDWRNSTVANTQIYTNKLHNTNMQTHTQFKHVHTHVHTNRLYIYKQTYLSCTRAGRQRSVAPTRGQPVRLWVAQQWLPCWIHLLLLLRVDCLMERKRGYHQLIKHEL